MTRMKDAPKIGIAILDKKHKLPNGLGESGLPNTILIICNATGQ